MKFAVILALFVLVAVSYAQPIEGEEGSPVAESAAPEKREAAPAEGKDLDTANSYIYGGYPYYGGYGGYGGYGLGYGGYYPAYGGYGAYGVPAYYGLYY